MVDTGAGSPGTMADDNAFGSAAWSNVDNAKTQNDTDATMSTGNTNSHYLKATNFGFSVPVGATIDGIVVEIDRHEAGAGTCKDVEVKIVKADGSIGTENKGDTVNAWPTSDTDTYKSYGAVDNLWSETWSAANINDSDFGVVLAVYDSQARIGVQAAVDHMRITVYYTEAAAGETRAVKISGTFADKPYQIKISGTFVEKPVTVL